MVGSRNSKRRQHVISALEQHEGALTRYAARMLGDVEAALDVVQHAFLQLCSQSDEQFPEQPKPWLFKVCRNRILDLQRKADRHSEWLEASESLHSDSAPDPAELAEHKDMGDWLQGLVDQLPPSQREVIVLWCQGFRYGQIAEITNQKEGGVRVKAHRGFTRLREHPAVRALLAMEGADPAGGGPTIASQPNVTAGESSPQKDRIS